MVELGLAGYYCCATMESTSLACLNDYRFFAGGVPEWVAVRRWLYWIVGGYVALLIAQVISNDECDYECRWL